MPLWSEDRFYVILKWRKVIYQFEAKNSHMPIWSVKKLYPFWLIELVASGMVGQGVIHYTTTAPLKWRKLIYHFEE